MKKIEIEIKWAVIFSIILLVWMLIEHSFGLHDEHINQHAIYSNLFAILAIGVYIFAIKDKKRNFYKDNMSFKQGFISGVILSIIVAILSPIGQFITFTFISPNFFENIITYSVSHKIQTQEQAEAYFNLNNYLLQGVFGSLSMGVVTSAIVVYFLKSKNK